MVYGGGGGGGGAKKVRVRGGGEGHCIVQSFQAGFKRFNRGSVLELVREGVPEVRSGCTEGSAAHCLEISTGNVKSGGVAGAKVTDRYVDSDEIAQVAGAFFVNGPDGDTAKDKQGWLSQEWGDQFKQCLYISEASC